MFQETQTNISFPDERELSFYSYIHDISFTPYNIHVSSTLPPPKRKELKHPNKMNLTTYMFPSISHAPSKANHVMS